MTLRRTVQLVSLGLFFALFIAIPGHLLGVVPPDLYLRADPLVALGTILAAAGPFWIFWPALVVAVSGLFMGRAYCGYVCPLGTLQDVFFGLGGKIPKERETGGDAGVGGNFPYLVLVLSLAAAAAGLSLLGWTDPLIILLRATATLVAPLIRWVGLWSLDHIGPLDHILAYRGWILSSADRAVGYGLSGASLLLVGVLAASALWRRRPWCRYACPLGALLGIMGRWAPIRRRVEEGCTDCGACLPSCPMGALGPEPKGTDSRRCLVCRRCAEACPQGAIGFLPGFGNASSPLGGRKLSRRGLFAASAAGLLLGLTARVDARSSGGKEGLIRPPGALPEPLFLNRCLRCGLCVEACVTGTLRPALLQGGWEGLWTPRADLRAAPCEQYCNRCGLVCPTGAIRPLEPLERIHAKMGTAILRRERCLVWEQDKACLVCDEICPYDAITFRQVGGMPRPFVTESRCNGCGQCEHKCPVKGASAIVVVPAGEIRLEKGSYREEARRLGLVFTGARGSSGEDFPEVFLK